MPESPYIGEIYMFGGNFPPRGYAFCDGQTLSISQNNALFSLIGTTFGGDGQNYFTLPDLRSRIPVGMGQGAGQPNRNLGDYGGQENITLSIDQIPAHSHTPLAVATPGTNAGPANAIWAVDAAGVAAPYASSGTLVPMEANLVGFAGGGSGHNNMMPFLCVNFVIALEGVYPPRP